MSRRPRHPDFGPGNTAAERHGAHSERRVAPLADAFDAELPAIAPHTARPGFAPGRRRYARAAAIAELLWRYIAEHGPLDDEGNPRPVLDQLHRWETTAAARGAALGLDPAAFAKLVATYATLPGADASDVLDALRAEGRRIIEARGLVAGTSTGDGTGSPLPAAELPDAANHHDGTSEPQAVAHGPHDECSAS